MTKQTITKQTITKQKGTKQTLKTLENKVKNTIEKYNLITKKDRILVAASGGKDSTVVLRTLNNLNYKPQALTIDLGIGGYSQTSLKNLQNFCKKHKIKLHKTSLKKEFGYSLCYIKSLLKQKGISLNSCSICGVLRRYILNKKARKLNFTKIATGHNLDDEAQSILMNLLRKAPQKNARLGPITGMIKDKKFVPRIKPLYFCPEKEITAYSKALNLNVLYTKCPCAIDAYRNTVRDLLNSYEKKHRNTKQNIINSFLKSLPKLKNHYKTNKNINHCKYCNEPSKGNICRSCQIISLLKT